MGDELGPGDLRAAQGSDDGLKRLDGCGVGAGCLADQGGDLVDVARRLKRRRVRWQGHD